MRLLAFLMLLVMYTSAHYVSHLERSFRVGVTWRRILFRFIERGK